VLARGNLDQVTVTGLDPGAEYHFQLFEYNRSANTGNWPLYNLCHEERANVYLDAGPGSIGAPLHVTKSQIVPGDLVLSWGLDCGAAAEDYGIYEGKLGNWGSHTALDCVGDVGGPLTEKITPSNGNRYYLVVPYASGIEGSYGTRSDGIERNQGLATCVADWTLGVCE